jgi:UDP-N-acetyl-D-mannosaminuronate dehydrogenase
VLANSRASTSRHAANACLRAQVDYCDPFLPEALPTRNHDLGMKSVACTAEAFAGFDVVLVSTARDQFKDPGLWADVKLVVDTHNMIEPLFGAGLAGGPKRLVKA